VPRQVVGLVELRHTNEQRLLPAWLPYEGFSSFFNLLLANGDDSLETSSYEDQFFEIWSRALFKQQSKVYSSEEGTND
jgi:hypothetical protein